MDAPNVEEMPIRHDQEEMTDEEMDLVIEYCINDVENTTTFYHYTVGEVEHELYKGVNKIQDRFDLREEMGFPDKVLNWSDVKIGDEINKLMYLKNTGMTWYELQDLLATRESRAGFTYGQCIPDYVEFQTTELKNFLDRMRPIRVNLNEKEEFPLEFKGTRYLIAKGGLHSNEKNRIVKAILKWILRDADIGSQYPHSIIKRLLYPYILGVAWLTGYTGIRNKRLEYKPLGKTNKKYQGLSDMFKLSLNGGGFGGSCIVYTKPL